MIQSPHSPLLRSSERVSVREGEVCEVVGANERAIVLVERDEDEREREQVTSLAERRLRLVSRRRELRVRG